MSRGKTKEQELLEECYESISRTDEGIVSRAIATGAGLAGVGRHAIVKTFGSDKTAPSMGAAYARSQQVSLFNRFIKKLTDRQNAFRSDIEKLTGLTLVQIYKDSKYRDMNIQGWMKHFNDLINFLNTEKNNLY